MSGPMVVRNCEDLGLVMFAQFKKLKLSSLLLDGTLSRLLRTLT